MSAPSPADPADVAWHARGLLFENCNCQLVCPGHMHFDQLCTHERCIGYWAIRVDDGRFGDVDLSGLKAVVAFDAPPHMISATGPRSSSSTRPPRRPAREALEAILSGRAGGPWALLARFVGRWLDTRYLPIEIVRRWRDEAARIAGLFDAVVTQIRGRDRSRPVMFENIFNQIHAPSQVIATRHDDVRRRDDRDPDRQHARAVLELLVGGRRLVVRFVPLVADVGGDDDRHDGAERPAVGARVRSPRERGPRRQTGCALASLPPGTRPSGSGTARGRRRADPAPPRGWLSHAHVLAAPLGAVVLIAAGLFQFAPARRACLTHCRNPLTHLLARWRGGVSGFRIGLAHGAHCVGCCWALMATAFAVGVMNLWWMAALAAIAAIEQTAPHGDRVGGAFGLALAGWGVVLLVR